MEGWAASTRGEKDMLLAFWMHPSMLKGMKENGMKVIQIRRRGCVPWEVIISIYSSIYQLPKILLVMTHI